MKLVVASLLSVSIGLIIGFLVGDTSASFEHYKQSEEKLMSYEGIQKVTATYKPTCAQLAIEGFSSPISEGGSYIWVFSGVDDFKVIGMHFSESGGVYFDWWGAGKSQETCETI